MQKIRIFLNARASHGKADVWRKEVSRHLFRSDLKFIEPKSIVEFDLELDRAIMDTTDVIISVGGDGTVHRLIQKLAGTSTSFLVIPAGTANDFASELGIKGKLSQAIHCIRDNQPRTIDLISINGRFMASNGGLGVASQVASQINKLRQKLPGFRSLMAGLNHEIYSLQLGWALISQSPPLLKLSLEREGQIRHFETPLFLVNNQASLAGDFFVAPDTKNDDGLFNMTIFKHKKRTELIQSILRIKRGMNPIEDPQIETFECNKAKITSSEPLEFFGDGELWPASDQWLIYLKHHCLKVFTLKNSVEEEFTQSSMVGH